MERWTGRRPRGSASGSGSGSGRGFGTGSGSDSGRGFEREGWCSRASRDPSAMSAGAPHPRHRSAPPDRSATRVSGAERPRRARPDPSRGRGRTCEDRARRRQTRCARESATVASSRAVETVGGIREPPKCVTTPTTTKNAHAQSENVPRLFVFQRYVTGWEWPPCLTDARAPRSRCTLNRWSSPDGISLTLAGAKRNARRTSRRRRSVTFLGIRHVGKQRRTPFPRRHAPRSAASTATTALAIPPTRA